MFIPAKHLWFFASLVYFQSPLKGALQWNDKANPSPLYPEMILLLSSKNPVLQNCLRIKLLSMDKRNILKWFLPFKKTYTQPCISIYSSYHHEMCLHWMTKDSVDYRFQFLNWKCVREAVSLFKTTPKGSNKIPQIFRRYNNQFTINMP